jgi:hypothetical protein
MIGVGTIRSARKALPAAADFVANLLPLMKFSLGLILALSEWEHTVLHSSLLETGLGSATLDRRIWHISTSAYPGHVGCDVLVESCGLESFKV